MKIDRINVLGVGISILDMQSAQKALVRAIEVGSKGYVCITGVHGVMESQRDPLLKEIHNRALACTPDGMPMVWMGRLQGFKQMDRVYGPDLMLEMLRASVDRGIRHFFYGGANGAAEELKLKMTERFPGIQIVGTYEPPFRPLNTEEARHLSELIGQTRPDILCSGLSTPKQERFMAEYLPRLDTTLMIGVGAAFDFHSGRVRQAPRWMQRSGLEWFFRLCTEPRRLWRRYLRNNPGFLYGAICQLLGLKKFVLE